MVFFSAVFLASAADRTWDGSTDTAWEEGTNWDTAPDNSDNVIITGTLTNYPVINSSNTIANIALEYGDLTLSNGANLAVTGNVLGSGNLSLQGDTTVGGYIHGDGTSISLGSDDTLEIGGNINLTYSTNDLQGIVTLTGSSDRTISSNTVPFEFLKVNTTGTGNTLVSDNLTVFDLEVLSGNLMLAGGYTLDSYSDIDVNGSLVLLGGNLNVEAISGSSRRDLSINGSSNLKLEGGSNIQVRNFFVSTGSSFEGTGDCTISVNGLVNLESDPSNWTSGQGAIEILGTGSSYTFSGVPLYDLVLVTGSNVIANSTNLHVSNDLTVAAGANAEFKNTPFLVDGSLLNSSDIFFDGGEQLVIDAMNQNIGQLVFNSTGGGNIDIVTTTGIWDPLHTNELSVLNGEYTLSTNLSLGNTLTTNASANLVGANLSLVMAGDNLWNTAGNMTLTNGTLSSNGTDGYLLSTAPGAALNLTGTSVGRFSILNAEGSRWSFDGTTITSTNSILGEQSVWSMNAITMASSNSIFVKNNSVWNLEGNSAITLSENLLITGSSSANIDTNYVATGNVWFYGSSNTNFQSSNLIVQGNIFLDAGLWRFASDNIDLPNADSSLLVNNGSRVEIVEDVTLTANGIVLNGSDMMVNGSNLILSDNIDLSNASTFRFWGPDRYVIQAEDIISSNDSDFRAESGTLFEPVVATSNVTLSTAGSSYLHDVNVNNAITLAVGDDITIMGNITVANGGALDMDTHDLNLNGANLLLEANSTYSSTAKINITNTVMLGDEKSNINLSDLANISIGASACLIMTDGFKVTGDLTNAGTLVAGDQVIADIGGTFNNTGTVSLYGDQSFPEEDFDTGLFHFTEGPTGTVTIGSGTPSNYYDLQLSYSGNPYAIGGAGLVVYGDLTISDGSSLDIADGQTLTLRQDFGGDTDNISNEGTIVFAGSTSTTFSAGSQNLGDVTIGDGVDNKTLFLGSDATFTNLTVISGSNIDLQGFDLTVTGNLVLNSGSFMSSDTGSNLIFSSNSTVDLDGDADITNLQVATGASLTPETDITVIDTINLDGTLQTFNGTTIYQITATTIDNDGVLKTLHLDTVNATLTADAGQVWISGNNGPYSIGSPWYDTFYDLKIGEDWLTVSDVTLNNAYISDNSLPLNIDVSAANTLTIGATSLTISDNLTIGTNASLVMGSTNLTLAGNIVLSDNTLVTTGDLEVGGTGNLNFTSYGNITVDGNLLLGGHWTLNQARTTLLGGYYRGSGNSFYELVIDTDDTVSSDNMFTVSSNLTVEDGILNLSGSPVNLADVLVEGAGNLMFTDGLHVISGNLSVDSGGGFAVYGQVQVAGNTTLLSGSSFAVRSGELQVTGDLWNLGSSSLTGGDVNVSSQWVMGGATSLYGANVTITDNATLTSSLTMSSGNLELTSGNLDLSGSLVQSNGNVSVSGNLDVSGTYSLSTNSLIVGSNVILDSGTWILTDANPDLSGIYVEMMGGDARFDVYDDISLSLNFSEGSLNHYSGNITLPEGLVMSGNYVYNTGAGNVAITGGNLTIQNGGDFDLGDGGDLYILGSDGMFTDGSLSGTARSNIHLDVNLLTSGEVTFNNTTYTGDVSLIGTATDVITGTISTPQSYTGTVIGLGTVDIQADIDVDGHFSTVATSLTLATSATLTVSGNLNLNASGDDVGGTIVLDGSDQDLYSAGVNIASLELRQSSGGNVNLQTDINIFEVDIFSGNLNIGDQDVVVHTDMSVGDIVEVGGGSLTLLSVTGTTYKDLVVPNGKTLKVENGGELVVNSLTLESGSHYIGRGDHRVTVLDVLSIETDQFESGAGEYKLSGETASIGFNDAVFYDFTVGTGGNIVASSTNLWVQNNMTIESSAFLELQSTPLTVGGCLINQEVLTSDVIETLVIQSMDNTMGTLAFDKASGGTIEIEPLTGSRGEFHVHDLKVLNGPYVSSTNLVVHDDLIMNADASLELVSLEFSSSDPWSTAGTLTVENGSFTTSSSNPSLDLVSGATLVVNSATVSGLSDLEASGAEVTFSRSPISTSGSFTFDSGSNLTLNRSTLSLDDLTVQTGSSFTIRNQDLTVGDDGVLSAANVIFESGNLWVGGQLTLSAGTNLTLSADNVYVEETFSADNLVAWVGTSENIMLDSFLVVSDNSHISHISSTNIFVDNSLFLSGSSNLYLEASSNLNVDGLASLTSSNMTTMSANTLVTSSVTMTDATWNNTSQWISGQAVSLSASELGSSSNNLDFAGLTLSSLSDATLEVSGNMDLAGALSATSSNLTTNSSNLSVTSTTSFHNSSWEGSSSANMELASYLILDNTHWVWSHGNIDVGTYLSVPNNSSLNLSSANLQTGTYVVLSESDFNVSSSNLNVATYLSLSTSSNVHTMGANLAIGSTLTLDTSTWNSDDDLGIEVNGATTLSNGSEWDLDNTSGNQTLVMLMDLSGASTTHLDTDSGVLLRFTDTATSFSVSGNSLIHNVQIDNNIAVTMGSDLFAMGNVSVLNGGDLDMNGNHLTVSGGNLSLASGSDFTSAGMTFQFESHFGDNKSPANLSDLDDVFIAGNADVTLTGGFYTAGSLSVNGILDIGDELVSDIGGTFENNGTIQLTGENGFPVSDIDSGNFQYTDGPSASIVIGDGTPSTYWNLQVSSTTNTYLLDGAGVTVQGDLTIDSGANIFVDDAQSLTLFQDFTADGNSLVNDGVFILGGNTSADLRSAGINLGVIQIGDGVNDKLVTLQDDLSFDELTVFSSGNLDLDNNDIYPTGNLSVNSGGYIDARSTSNLMVSGNVEVKFNGLSGLQGTHIVEGGNLIQTGPFSIEGRLWIEGTHYTYEDTTDHDLTAGSILNGNTLQTLGTAVIDASMNTDDGLFWVTGTSGPYALGYPSLSEFHDLRIKQDWSTASDLTIHNELDGGVDITVNSDNTLTFSANAVVLSDNLTIADEGMLDVSTSALTVASNVNLFGYGMISANHLQVAASGCLISAANAHLWIHEDLSISGTWDAGESIVTLGAGGNFAVAGNTFYVLELDAAGDRTLDESAVISSNLLVSQGNLTLTSPSLTAGNVVISSMGNWIQSDNLLQVDGEMEIWGLALHIGDNTTVDGNITVVGSWDICSGNLNLGGNLILAGGDVDLKDVEDDLSGLSVEMSDDAELTLRDNVDLNLNMSSGDIVHQGGNLTFSQGLTLMGNYLFVEGAGNVAVTSGNLTISEGSTFDTGSGGNLLVLGTAELFNEGELATEEGATLFLSSITLLTGESSLDGDVEVDQVNVTGGNLLVIGENVEVEAVVLSGTGNLVLTGDGSAELDQLEMTGGTLHIDAMSNLLVDSSMVTTGGIITMEAGAMLTLEASANTSFFGADLQMDPEAELHLNGGDLDVSGALTTFSALGNLIVHGILTMDAATTTTDLLVVNGAIFSTDTNALSVLEDTNVESGGSLLVDAGGSLGVGKEIKIGGTFSADSSLTVFASDTIFEAGSSIAGTFNTDSLHSASTSVGTNSDFILSGSGNLSVTGSAIDVQVSSTAGVNVFVESSFGDLDNNGDLQVDAPLRVSGTFDNDGTVTDLGNASFDLTNDTDSGTFVLTQPNPSLGSNVISEFYNLTLNASTSTMAANTTVHGNLLSDDFGMVVTSDGYDMEVLGAVGGENWSLSGCLVLSSNVEVNGNINVATLTSIVPSTNILVADGVTISVSSNLEWRGQSSGNVQWTVAGNSEAGFNINLADNADAELRHLEVVGAEFSRRVFAYDSSSSDTVNLITEFISFTADNGEKVGTVTINWTQEILAGTVFPDIRLYRTDEDGNIFTDGSDGGLVASGIGNTVTSFDWSSNVLDDNVEDQYIAAYTDSGTIQIISAKLLGPFTFDNHLDLIMEGADVPTYDPDTGILTLEFDHDIDDLSANVILSDIAFTTDSQSEDLEGLSYTVDGTELQVQLDDPFRVTAYALFPGAQALVEVGSVSAGVRSFSFEQDTLISLLDDLSGPTLNQWELNLNTRFLTLEFDEPLDGNWSSNLITLNDVALTTTSGTWSSASASNLVLSLNSTDFEVVDGLNADTIDLDLTAGFVQDLVGNDSVASAGLAAAEVVEVNDENLFDAIDSGAVEAGDVVTSIVSEEGGMELIERADLFRTSYVLSDVKYSFDEDDTQVVVYNTGPAGAVADSSSFELRTLSEVSELTFEVSGIPDDTTMVSITTDLPNNEIPDDMVGTEVLSFDLFDDDGNPITEGFEITITFEALPGAFGKYALRSRQANGEAFVDTGFSPFSPTGDVFDGDVSFTMTHFTQFILVDTEVENPFTSGGGGGGGCLLK